MATIEVSVPDIGDFADVEIIELLVSAGDRVAVEDPLITLESDKASMDVPSSAAGVVKELKVSVGDKVSEGSLILLLEEETGDGSDSSDSGGTDAETKADARRESGDDKSDDDKSDDDKTAASASAGGAAQDIKVPDIGDFTDVEVIEVHVEVGDRVAVEDPLITLESDKASMDVPAPAAGVIAALEIGVGDRVSEGTLIARLQSDQGDARADQDKAQSKAGKDNKDRADPRTGAGKRPAGKDGENSAARSGAGQRPPPPAPAEIDEVAFARVHASPSIRRFARELGVDLSKVEGSGRKNRITREDVQQYVKRSLAAVPATPAAGTGAGIPRLPEIDFSKFGEIEEQPLTRIQRLSGPHLHRAWLNVPMVTQFDEADITELENFRQSLKKDAEKRGVRVTALVFIMKAVAAALREYPKFNSSLAADAQSLILKKYCHLGIAVDTPGGLVVPVFRDVDRKSVFELSVELSEVSLKAREGKLSPNDMQGGCFSISSLGGIGGTNFTPIVNAPEVAILGVARGRKAPVWDERAGVFVPRLMLPLALTYDHRVIDGALGARFIVYLSEQLADIRRMLL